MSEQLNNHDDIQDMPEVETEEVSTIDRFLTFESAGDRKSVV